MTTIVNGEVISQIFTQMITISSTAIVIGDFAVITDVVVASATSLSMNMISIPEDTAPPTNESEIPDTGSELNLSGNTSDEQPETDEDGIIIPPTEAVTASSTTQDIGAIFDESFEKLAGVQSSTLSSDTLDTGTATSTTGAVSDTSCSLDATLKSGSSDNQTVASGSSIDEIVYDIITDCSRVIHLVSSSGLPSGVSASITGDELKISGTTTGDTSGTFNYSIVIDNHLEQTSSAPFVSATVSKVVNGTISVINTGTTTNTGTTSSTASGGGGSSGTTSSTGGGGDTNTGSTTSTTTTNTTDTSTSTNTGTTSSTGGGGDNSGTTTSTTTTNTTDTSTSTNNGTTSSTGGGGNNTGTTTSTTTTNTTDTSTSTNTGATSSTFEVTLTSDKTNDTICEGDSVVFSATASLNDAPVEYEFSINGVLMTSLSASNVFTTASDQIIDQDFVEVRATYDGDIVSSHSILMSVNAPVMNLIQLNGLEQVCDGDVPGEILGNNINGTTTYIWQSSVDGLNWNDIPNNNSQNYQPPALTQTTQFRRITLNEQNGVTCESSVSISISVTPANQSPCSSLSSSTTSTETFAINVTASSASDYTLSGSDRNGNVTGNDPSVTIKVGDTIDFAVDASGHPFYLKTVQGTGTSDLVSGVTNNGATNGTVSWTPTAAGTYYYQCSLHNGMYGTITVN
jgi:plastocyanin